ncbi:MAG: hypothetical protein QG657_2065 [Acidobacteriota bacterium]|nr:hypothetical protein [Acidobacteriota bacterium]
MKKVNMLLVNDEQIVINTWKKSFDPTKYEITEARSGAEALDFVKKLKELDKNARLVVLLDVVMPGLNGIAVLRRIKTEFPFSKVYIITGNTVATDIPDVAYSTGLYRGDRFFLKQKLDMDDLIAEIEKGIREQESQFKSTDAA